MIGLLWFVLAIFIWPLRSDARLEAENAVLRQQLLVLRRKCRGRVRLTNFDRWIFVQLYRLFPSVLQVLQVIRPETLVRWHRAGFLSYWRWKSRNRGGRPRINTDLRALIGQMSLENRSGARCATNTEGTELPDLHTARREPGKLAGRLLLNEPNTF